MFKFLFRDKIFVNFSVIALVFLSTNIGHFGKETSGEENSIAKQIIGISFALYCFILMVKDVDLIVFFRKNLLFFILHFFMLLSIIWSEDQLRTIKGLVLSFSLTTFLIVIKSKANWSEIFDKIFGRYLIICLIFSLFFIAFLNQGWMIYEDQGRVPQGVFFHKNYFGRFLCLSIPFYLYKILSTPKSILNLYHISIIIISVLLLLMTKSTTSLFILLISITIIAVTFNKYIKTFLIYSIPILIILTGLYQSTTNRLNFNGAIDTILHSAGKDRTLNGRSRLHELLIADGLKRHPIIGAGYCAYFKGYTTRWLELMDEFAPGHAHNSYIQVFLDLGLVGLFLMLITILYSINKNMRSLLFSIKIDTNYYLAVCFFNVLFFGFIEPGLLGNNHLMSIIFLMGLINHKKEKCYNEL